MKVMMRFKRKARSLQQFTFDRELLVIVAGSTELCTQLNLNCFFYKLYKTNYIILKVTKLRRAYRNRPPATNLGIGTAIEVIYFNYTI